MAEMGLVASDPEYRKRGLQRILNNEFDKRIREDGYHLTAIEGIPYFYRQFGYEYSVPLDEWAALPIQKLPNQPSHDISHLTPRRYQGSLNYSKLAKKNIWCTA